MINSYTCQLIYKADDQYERLTLSSTEKDQLNQILRAKKFDAHDYNAIDVSENFALIHWNLTRFDGSQRLISRFTFHYRDCPELAKFLKSKLPNITIYA